MAGIALVSCKRDDIATPSQSYNIEKVQSTQMKNFSDALQKIGKGGMLYVEPNGQLNQAGIDILLPAAQRLLLESGSSENRIEGLDSKSTINEGFAVYSNQLKKDHLNIKAND